MDIERTTLNSICASYDKIIADCEVGQNRKLEKKQKHTSSFEDVDTVGYYSI